MAKALPAPRAEIHAAESCSQAQAARRWRGERGPGRRRRRRRTDHCATGAAKESQALGVPGNALSRPQSCRPAPTETALTRADKAMMMMMMMMIPMPTLKAPPGETGQGVGQAVMTITMTTRMKGKGLASGAALGERMTGHAQPLSTLVENGSGFKRDSIRWRCQVGWPMSHGRTRPHANC